MSIEPKAPRSLVIGLTLAIVLVLAVGAGAAMLVFSGGTADVTTILASVGIFLVLFLLSALVMWRG